MGIHFQASRGAARLLFSGTKPSIPFNNSTLMLTESRLHEAMMLNWLMHAWALEGCRPDIWIFAPHLVWNILLFLPERTSRRKVRWLEEKGLLRTRRTREGLFMQPNSASGLT